MGMKTFVYYLSDSFTLDVAYLIQMKRSDLRHRLLKESSSQIHKFNIRRRFFIISSAIIAKSKFERKKKLASCMSANSLHEALNLTFADLYEMQGKLGSGGFATVFKAHQKRTAELVAVKVFDRRTMTQQEQQNLHQEKAILLRLSHPHIIKCLDIFEEPTSFFIVMELVTGGELFDRLAHKKNYSEEEARNVILILLSAIRHCHDNDIVHRYVIALLTSCVR
jgi:serine/threonine protein kinase